MICNPESRSLVLSLHLLNEQAPRRDSQQSCRHGMGSGLDFCCRGYSDAHSTRTIVQHQPRLRQPRHCARDAGAADSRVCTRELGPHLRASVAESALPTVIAGVPYRAGARLGSGPAREGDRTGAFPVQHFHCCTTFLFNLFAQGFAPC